MGREDFCSKKTNPSPNHPVREVVVGRRQSALRYQRNHDHQDPQDLDQVDRAGMDPNHRMKWLLRWFASLGQRIASVEVDRNLVEDRFVGGKATPAVADNLVEGYMIQVVHKRSAGGEGRLVGGKENLVVESMAFQVVEARTVRPAVEGKARLVAEGRESLVSSLV